MGGHDERYAKKVFPCMETCKSCLDLNKLGEASKEYEVCEEGREGYPDRERLKLPFWREGASEKSNSPFLFRKQSRSFRD